jgi:hypothetical protein
LIKIVPECVASAETSTAVARTRAKTIDTSRRGVTVSARRSSGLM